MTKIPRYIDASMVPSRLAHPAHRGFWLFVIPIFFPQGRVAPESPLPHEDYFSPPHQTAKQPNSRSDQEHGGKRNQKGKGISTAPLTSPTTEPPFRDDGHDDPLVCILCSFLPMVITPPLCRLCELCGVWECGRSVWSATPTYARHV